MPYIRNKESLKKKQIYLKATRKKLTSYKVTVVLTWVRGDVLPLVHLVLKVVVFHYLILCLSVAHHQQQMWKLIQLVH